MKKNFIYSLFALTFILSACSTDLDVTGDWKETMVVYGLLDQSKDTQFIKINRAFLGQGDAALYAQIKDSVQYSTPLTVSLVKVGTSTTLTLLPTDSIIKDPGAFYYTDQTNAIYSVYTPPGTFNPNSQYKITIKNNETGLTATAQTPLVGDITLTKPSTGPSFYFVNPFSPNYPFAVEWNSSKNGRLYQLVIRLNYKDSTTAGVVTSRYLDWTFAPLKSDNLNGGQALGFTFPGKNFLKYIATQIQPDPTIYRIPGNVELLVTGGADDLSTFIDVNKPSTGIIQERPEFTNITGGMGIFSSRVTKSFIRPMEASTIDTLSGGQFTKCLRFLNTSGTWTNPGGCP